MNAKKRERSLRALARRRSDAIFWSDVMISEEAEIQDGLKKLAKHKVEIALQDVRNLERKLGIK